MNESDLKRSYYQYLYHIKNGHLNLNIFQKLSLSFIFFLIMVLSFVCSFFCSFDFKKNKNYYVIDHSDIDPHKSIKKELCKENFIKPIKISNIYFPILPIFFYKEIFENLKFYIKVLPFLGAISIKISKYYFLYHKHNIKVLIVFQEYSFYMSYLTYILENSGAQLFNMMHGIPGKEASFFRFSKCFVWGNYYKKFYLSNHADEKQFVIAGSIYHKYLFSRINSTIPNDYDVVYFMQGADAVRSDELNDVLATLNALSKKYKVAIKQHPMYKININTHLEVIETSNIIDIINKTKVIVSHFSTALLDSKIMGKISISYSKKDRSHMTSFLTTDEIINSKESLFSFLSITLDRNILPSSIDPNIVDLNLDTLQIIKKELHNYDFTL